MEKAINKLLAAVAAVASAVLVLFVFITDFATLNIQSFIALFLLPAAVSVAAAVMIRRPLAARKWFLQAFATLALAATALEFSLRQIPDCISFSIKISCPIQTTIRSIHDAPKIHC